MTQERGETPPEDRMLKNRITAEEHGALPEPLKEHYTKGADGAFFLQTEEATTLKRTLDTERRDKVGYSKVLKKIAPELHAQLTSDNREDWDELAEPESERLAELRKLDLDQVKDALAAAEGDKGKPDKDELTQKLRTAEQQARDAKREKETAEREKGKAAQKAARLEAENAALVQARDVDATLDAMKVTDPEDREIVRSILTAKSLVVREVGEAKEGEPRKRQTFVLVEGHEVPLVEHGKDFAGTSVGKRFVKAPDHAGAGDGPRPTPKPSKEQFEKMDPMQKLGAALESSSATAGAAAR